MTAMKIKSGVSAIFTYMGENLKSTIFPCRFCRHKINLEDALKDDFSLWSTISNMDKLAEWRKKANDLYQRARNQKFSLDQFYEENEKLTREFQKAEREHSWPPVSYSGGFEARCKKCKRLHTINLKLELDAPNFPEALSLEEKMKLQVSEKVLLRVAEKLRYPNLETYQGWLQGQEQTKLKGAVENFVSNHLEAIDCPEAKELKKELQGFMERIERELKQRKIKHLMHLREFVHESLIST